MSIRISTNRPCVCLITEREHDRLSEAAHGEPEEPEEKVSSRMLPPKDRLPRPTRG